MELKTDLTISTLIKTSTDNEILLLNNEYAKEIQLIIISKDTIEKKKRFKINDLNNLSLNDTELFIDILINYCNDKTEAYYILSELIDTLNNNKQNGYYETDNNNIISLYKDNIKSIEDKKQNDKIKHNNNIINQTKNNINIILNKVRGEDNPNNLNRSDLSEYIAKYLNLKYGLILRSNVNTPHIINDNNNCYELTDNETLLKLIASDFGNNRMSIKELIKSYDYINQRHKPSYNIIRFNNNIYDMERHETVYLNNPTLPYYDIYFNYNPNAKGELIQQFLYSSLSSNQVKGLLELIGYLFTVGNKENIIICFIGKGGGGKSVLSNIIAHIFKRVSYLPIHNLNTTHDLSSLENKLLNICNDTDNKPIEDNGTFKQITGADQLYINPKYRTPYTMPSEEVPYFIIVGNKFPKFKQLEIPIIERLMLIEFKKGFRNTKEQNKNLYEDIIKDSDNIEWLIYNSLKAYKNIAINNKEFTLRKTTEENLNLYNKHSNSLIWIIKQLCLFIEDDIGLYNYNNYDYEESNKKLNDYSNYIIVDDLKETIIKYADSEGLDILDKNNNLSTQKILKAIKSAFNLWDLDIEYKTVRKRIDNNREYVFPSIKYIDS